MKFMTDGISLTKREKAMVASTFILLLVTMCLA